MNLCVLTERGRPRLCTKPMGTSIKTMREQRWVPKIMQGGQTRCVLWMCASDDIPNVNKWDPVVWQKVTSSGLQVLTMREQRKVIDLRVDKQVMGRCLSEDFNKPRTSTKGLVVFRQREDVVALLLCTNQRGRRQHKCPKQEQLPGFTCRQTGCVRVTQSGEVCLGRSINRLHHERFDPFHKDQFKSY